MSNFELPSNAPLIDQDGTSSVPFLQWLSRIHNIALAVISSGTTTNRPTQNLWVGRTYFDTTLGIPLWWNGTAWITTTGVVMHHGSASLNFGSIASNGIGTLSFTVTGTVAGDRVILAAPAALEAGLTFSGIATAANTVTVRLHNNSGGSVNPAVATWAATTFSYP